MAFRKRNQPLNHHPQPQDPSASSPSSQPSSLSTRPSAPPQSRPQTHPTGTTSLDALLSLPLAYTASSGPGLALGTSLLVEESGTTDYAGVLARCYAAEGVVRGDVCHVVGAGRGWVGTLPGLVQAGSQEGGRRGLGNGTSEGKSEGRDGRGDGVSAGKMKIAWRYESLGAGGSGAMAPTAARERRPPGPTTNPDISSPDQKPSPTSTRGSHTFDLTKRLDLPPNTQIHHHAIPPTNPPNQYQNHQQQASRSTTSPFTPLLTSLTQHLSQTPPSKTRRLIIPSLLSPAIPYPPHASHPSHILSFLHALRALLRLYPNRLTALITLPLDLYPRSKSLTRAIEHLVDGVIELAPFPHRLSVDAPVSDPSNNSGKKGVEEEPQGLIRVHKLPVLEERGMGGMGMANDLAFVVSRRRFEMRAYSLPPEVGDAEREREAQHGAGGGEGEGGKGKLPGKKDIEF